jgi:uncharacterized membrane protein YvbJ
MPFCPSCGAEFDIDWRFKCQNCGADLSVGMKECPKCGADLKERHCKKCGNLFMGKVGVH